MMKILISIDEATYDKITGIEPMIIYRADVAEVLEKGVRISEETYDAFKDWMMKNCCCCEGGGK